MHRNSMQCEDIVRDAVVEQFLAGSLPPAQREQFESHFLMCDRCQTALELGTAIRVALRTTGPQALTAGGPAKRVVRRKAAYIALAAAAVATIAITGVWRNQTTDMQKLGAVLQAPVYLGVPVRGDGDVSGEKLFDAAMRDYSAERYQNAAKGLREAIAGGVDEPPSQFFLGASLLASGNARAAVTAFTSVISNDDNPYRWEAYFYRAKAYLRLRERDRAVLDLTEAAKAAGEIGAGSRALRDSVMRPGIR